MAESIICNRAFEFAARILVVTDRIWSRGPAARHLSSQLLRCGTSIGANAEEAQEAQSKADFIAKLSIARKEARETRWWLRLAIKAKVVAAKEVEWEIEEINQLLAMLRSAILTTKERSSRPPHNS